MPKTDLKKELKQLYFPSAKECVMVEVPAMNFLMVHGAGSPEGSVAFQEAMGALYSVAYTLKFMLKKSAAAGVAPVPDSVVMPLEGLWWADDMEAFDPTGAEAHRKDQWKWTAMIMQPPRITAELVEAAKAEIRAKAKKGKPVPPGLGRLTFERFDEGLSAQIMHLGPYSAEAPIVQRLHAFIREQGRRLRGKHHEIYLGDPRRGDPAKLKTVIRQPVA